MSGSVASADARWIEVGDEYLHQTRMEEIGLLQDLHEYTPIRLDYTTSGYFRSGLPSLYIYILCTC
jgi:hypothetical protein